jgi:hypothetical protein
VRRYRSQDSAVALDDAGHRQRPVDAEGLIVETRTIGKLGPIEVGHHVQHLAIHDESLETVRNPAGM